MNKIIALINCFLPMIIISGYLDKCITALMLYSKKAIFKGIYMKFTKLKKMIPYKNTHLSFNLCFKGKLTIPKVQNNAK